MSHIDELNKKNASASLALSKEIGRLNTIAQYKISKKEPILEEQRMALVLLSKVFKLGGLSNYNSTDDVYYDPHFDSFSHGIIKLLYDGLSYTKIESIKAHLAGLLFHHSKATEHSTVPCRFVLSPSLTLALSLTGLENTYSGDINMPFDSFIIQLPHDSATLQAPDHPTVQIAYICVSKSTSYLLGEGISYQALFSDDNNTNIPVLDVASMQDTIDTGIKNKTTGTPLDIEESIKWSTVFNAIIGSLISQDTQQKQKDALQKIKTKAEEMTNNMSLQDRENFLLSYIGGHTMIFFGKPYTGHQIKEQLSRIVVNTILYINSSSAKITHGNQAEIDKLKPLAKGKKGQKMKAHQAQKKIQELEQEPVWNLETKVALDPNLIKQYSKENQGTGTPRSHSWITRGHWRQQACGERWSKHKPKWIAPFVCLRHMPPTYGHEYTIKDPTGTDD
jgi:hypothetical protein